MNKHIMRFTSIILCFISLYVLYHFTSFPVFSNHRNNKVIVIDVGHGGNDPGKVNTNGIKEKDINLQIASYLKDYLIAQDYIVYLTRETDCNLCDENAKNKKRSDLNNRIKFIKEKNAFCVVSIHQNSFPDTIQHGAQTFYFQGNEDSKCLADMVQSSLLQIDDTNTRQIKSTDSYFLLKHSPVPSVIIECGFLSNLEEAAKLTDSNYQKQLAYAICMGICRYAK